MTKKRILTGDRPTGSLHLGHYVGSVANRVRLQDEYDTFIIIADVQALTTNFDRPERLSEDVRNVALDNIAAGLDPEKVTFFIQSYIPQIAELTIYYSMFISVNQLRHNPTIKTEAKAYGYSEMTYGFLGYPVSQAADITFCRADVVPVGEDQVPHIEVTRKIVRRFNELYGEVFPEPEALVSPVGRLIGLDGNAKMSKSLNNCIYLTEASDLLATKIKGAVTDPARIRRNDLGHPEVCTIFSYQKAFNQDFVAELEPACRSAEIGCVDCKKRLITALEELLSPMRERRIRYEKPGLLDEILLDGNKKTLSVAEETMSMVRSAMKLDYWNIWQK